MGLGEVLNIIHCVIETMKKAILTDEETKPMGFSLHCHTGINIAPYISYLRKLKYERFGAFRQRKLIYESTSFEEDSCPYDIEILQSLQIDFTIHNHPFRLDTTPEFAVIPSPEDIYLFQERIPAKFHLICGPKNIVRVEMPEKIPLGKIEATRILIMLLSAERYKERLLDIGVILHTFDYEKDLNNQL